MGRSTMVASRTLASVLLLIADSAIARPLNWVTRSNLGYGGCGGLITELTPAQLQNEGMGGNGFSQVEPSTDVTLAADGISYEIPVPEAANLNWMVTVKQGVLGPLPGDPDRSNPACPNLFQVRQGGTTSSAVLWTPPAGASGDYTIDVGFAPGFGEISYNSFTVSIAAADSPAPSLPPPSPTQPAPTPASPLPTPPPPSPTPPTVPAPLPISSPPLPILSPPAPVLSPPAPSLSPPLPILSPPSPNPSPSAPVYCTRANPDCHDGSSCTCSGSGSQRKILFFSTPETCVCT